MTAQTPTVLKTYFETGDRPSQAQFANLIDSYINTIQTGGQVITSDVSALGAFQFKKDITVSGNATIGGALSAGSLSLTNLTVTGTVSAANFNATGNIIGNAGSLVAGLSVGTTVSANAASITTTVSAAAFKPTSTSGVIGTKTNDNAAAGSIGEFISSDIGSGSAISLTFNTAADLTTISLTAGDWDVTANICFLPAVANLTQLTLWTNNVSLIAPNLENICTFSGIAAAPGSGAFCTSAYQRRFSLSGTTTIYLTCQAVFSGTCTAYGRIDARRVR